MRWYWIDRFLEFQSGRSATAVKHVSAAEEHLRDHFPGCPVMPGTLVMEGLAQAGGLLVFEHHRFTENPILAKVPSVRFYSEAQPGDTLTYRVTIEEIKKEGALVRGTSHVGPRLQAEMQMVFAHFDGGHRKGALFDPQVFFDMLRFLGAYDVACAADGSRLPEPRLPAETLVPAGSNGPLRSDPPPRHQVVPR